MSVPDTIRTEIMERLAKSADQAGWLSLSAAAKSRFYANWTKDPAIGGRLARYLEPAAVRHYIKDALMKPYCRERRAEPGAVLALVGLSGTSPIRRRFIKPHGCELEDGKVVSWGRANTWKVVLMAVYERSFGNDSTWAYGVVLTQSNPHFVSAASRVVVEAAAKKLGIERLVWRLD